MNKSILNTKLNTMKIGERIRKLRLNYNGKKLSQSKFAEILGYSNENIKGTISQWEKGKATPPLDKLELISEKWGVSIDYILCKTDYTHVENKDISSITGLSDKAIEVLRAINNRSINLEKDTLSFINYELEKTYNDSFHNKDNELLNTLFAKMNQYISTSEAVVYYKKQVRIDNEIVNSRWSDKSNDVIFEMPQSNECLTVNGNELLSEYNLRVISNTLYEYRKANKKKQ